MSFIHLGEYLELEWKQEAGASENNSEIAWAVKTLPSSLRLTKKGTVVWLSCGTLA